VYEVAPLISYYWAVVQWSLTVSVVHDISAMDQGARISCCLVLRFLFMDQQKITQICTRIFFLRITLYNAAQEGESKNREGGWFSKFILSSYPDLHTCVLYT